MISARVFPEAVPPQVAQTGTPILQAFQPSSMNAGMILMDLDSSDGAGESAQEGSASPQAFRNSESSLELLVTQDNRDGFDPLSAEMGGSSDDTEVCPYRAGSDMGDVGMQLESSSAEGGGSPCDRDGMDLDSASDREEKAAVMPASGWRPGKDCGSFGGAPLVQVILTNLYLNACRLGSRRGKALLDRLLPAGEPPPKRNFADRIVAQMACVSRSRGRRAHDKLRDNGWAPYEEDESLDAKPALQFSRGCTDK